MKSFADTMHPGFISGLPIVRYPHCRSAQSLRRYHEKRFSVRALMSPNQSPAEPAISVDKGGRTLTRPMSHDETQSAFVSFINLMPGLWNSERTYHYMVPPTTRESSQTTFDVDVLDTDAIDDVLRRNAATTKSLSNWQVVVTHGFRVSFRTRMGDSDQLVIASTNLAFVPQAFCTNGLILGDYYRDLGYEESAPIKAQFVFDAAKSQLVMTTVYTKVVSVDTISLINPKLRLRNIVNYRRPKHGAPLSDVVLVGFGVESKSEGGRLVK